MMVRCASVLVCSFVAVRGVRVFAEKCIENERYFLFERKGQGKVRFFKILVSTITRFFSLLRSDDASSCTDDE